MRAYRLVFLLQVYRQIMVKGLAKSRKFPIESFIDQPISHFEKIGVGFFKNRKLVLQIKSNNKGPERRCI